MFTKIGKFLKPILGVRDHVPADAVRPIDPEERRKRKRRKPNKRKAEEHDDFCTDTMSLSLDAVKVMLEQEMTDDLDVYQRVLIIVQKLQKKNVTHIEVKTNQPPLEALLDTAEAHGVLSGLENK